MLLRHHPMPYTVDIKAALMTQTLTVATEEFVVKSIISLNMIEFAAIVAPCFIYLTSISIYFPSVTIQVITVHFLRFKPRGTCVFLHQVASIPSAHS